MDYITPKELSKIYNKSEKRIRKIKKLRLWGRSLTLDNPRGAKRLRGAV